VEKIICLKKYSHEFLGADVDVTRTWKYLHVYMCLFEELVHFQATRVEDTDRLPKFPTRRRPPRAAVTTPGSRASVAAPGS
jgi:hypothetical protein